jgi:hypothetical protein
MVREGNGHLQRLFGRLTCPEQTGSFREGVLENKLTREEQRIRCRTKIRAASNRRRWVERNRACQVWFSEQSRVRNGFRCVPHRICSILMFRQAFTHWISAKEHRTAELYWFWCYLSVGEASREGTPQMVSMVVRYAPASLFAFSSPSTVASVCYGTNSNEMRCPSGHGNGRADQRGTHGETFCLAWPSIRSSRSTSGRRNSGSQRRNLASERQPRGNGWLDSCAIVDRKW